MKWHMIRNKIVVINIGSKAQTVSVCHQTSGRDLNEGYKGWTIRPIIPWDREEYSIDKTIKYMLFHLGTPPKGFRTVREAKDYAEIAQKAFVNN